MGEKRIKVDESICNLAILGRCLMVSVPLTQVDHYESIRLGRIQMAAATEMVSG